jgi:uncharacterized protein (DUF305 family)
MDFSMKSLVAIAGLSLVTGGAIATAYFASPSRATPPLQPERPGWQRSLAQGYGHHGPMMGDLSQLSGDALDRAFLEGMIMHHREAVMMAHHLVNHGLVQHQPVQPFAENIARTQRQEISQMQAWLQDWFGVTSMPCPM